jgi:hypothetical protein
LSDLGGLAKEAEALRAALADAVTLERVVPASSFAEVNGVSSTQAALLETLVKAEDLALAHARQLGVRLREVRHNFGSSGLPTSGTARMRRQMPDFLQLKGFSQGSGFRQP